MIRLFNQYISPKTFVLMPVEAVLIALALVFGVRFRFWSSPVEFDSYIRFPDFALQALVFVTIFQLCFYYGDLYDLSAIRYRNEQWICLGQSLGAGSLLLGMVYVILPELLIGRGVFFISTTLAAIFIATNRIALEAAWRAAVPQEKVLVLGAHELARTVAGELVRREDLNIELVGFIELPDASADSPRKLFGRPILGSVNEMESVVMSRNVSRIVVAVEDQRGALPIRDLVKLRVQGVRVEDAHSMIAALSGRVWLRTVQPSWFVFSDGFHRSKAAMMFKRALDLVFALLGLVLSLPVMLIVALVVRLDSKGPVIFRQTRVGLGGRCFDLLKFRSMRADAEAKTGARWAAESDPRVTRVGGFLRKYRLDELPQFINVIRGEMSFVGPRPERPVFVEQLRREISYYDERHSVRPGLTGWAQVEYQYGGSVEDAFRKLEYDLFYLKNLSIFFDCAIILKTIRTVLTGHGGR